jgi:hypothetical protein
MATKQQGYRAYPIRPSLQGRKGGRKGPTANEGKKVGKEENRRKSFFKEDIPLCFCN